MNQSLSPATPLHEVLYQWALASTSLFNVIVLTWLGLTVLFNSDRRTWGVWLAGFGMLLGSVFFVCHTATLDYTFEALIQGIASWWYLSWACVIALPLGWYVLMLFYAGYWENCDTALYRRHRLWFHLTIPLMVILSVLIYKIDPHRFFVNIVKAGKYSPLAYNGTPLLVAIYPVYVTLCVSLSLDVLYRPGPTSRVMGDVARQRARPWLIASTIVQLIVSLLVCGTLLLVVWSLRHSRSMGVFFDYQLTYLLTGTDLAATALVAVAVVLTGKAIVSYEIFTGKALPRHGFLRQWRSIILLAGTYSLVVSYVGLRSHWNPILLVLLTTVLMSIFYAVFSWRSYTDRERYIGQLRPFVASQHLYDYLLASAPAAVPDNYARLSFHALCRDVLNARLAFLVALGPLRPLVGPPLGYPDDRDEEPAQLAEIVDRFTTNDIICAQLDPERHDGAVWAVPLSSDRGLCGLLLLGEKSDNGIYAQEEIEIARASGERLIDTLASAALAQRLMALQRRRLAESQVLDRRARRTLHDDILPRLHTAILSLGSVATPQNGTVRTDAAPDATTDAVQEALTQLGDAHRQISNLLREMPATAAPEVGRLGLVGALHAVVEKELTGAFDDVSWNSSPNAEAAAAQLSSLGSEVLFYAAREAIRNAARYGRPVHDHGHLKLAVTLEADEELSLVIADDGVGFDASRSGIERRHAEAERAATGGSGQGLTLHSTMMAVVGGSLAIESVPNEFTRVTLTLPRTAVADTRIS